MRYPDSIIVRMKLRIIFSIPQASRRCGKGTVALPPAVSVLQRYYLVHTLHPPNFLSRFPRFDLPNQRKLSVRGKSPTSILQSPPPNDAHTHKFLPRQLVYDSAPGRGAQTPEPISEFAIPSTDLSTSPFSLLIFLTA